MKTLVVFLIHLYRWTLGPLLHFVSGPSGGCRFEPTCSLYCLEAVQKHGVLQGAWLGIKRIVRCQPWGGQGVDPVPQTLKSHS